MPTLQNQPTAEICFIQFSSTYTSSELLDLWDWKPLQTCKYSSPTQVENNTHHLSTVVNLPVKLKTKHHRLPEWTLLSSKQLMHSLRSGWSICKDYTIHRQCKGNTRFYVFWSESYLSYRHKSTTTRVPHHVKNTKGGWSIVDAIRRKTGTVWWIRSSKIS